MNKIQELMNSTMDNLKTMAGVETVVGNPITCADGTIIVPISSVSFGFAAGGSEFSPKKDTAITEKMFGGGSGGGANVKPAGFLIITGGNVRFVPAGGDSSPVSKLVDMVPDMFDKVNGIVSNFGKKKNKNVEEVKDEPIEIVD